MSTAHDTEPLTDEDFLNDVFPSKVARDLLQPFNLVVFGKDKQVDLLSVFKLLFHSVNFLCCVGVTNAAGNACPLITAALAQHGLGTLRPGSTTFFVLDTNQLLQTGFEAMVKKFAHYVW